MRPLNNLTEDQYKTLKSTGLLFELYPKATGIYNNDIEQSTIRTQHRAKAKKIEGNWGILESYSEMLMIDKPFLIFCFGGKDKNNLNRPEKYNWENTESIHYFNWIEVYDNYGEVIYFGRVYCGKMTPISYLNKKEYIPADIVDRKPFISPQIWESFFDKQMFARAYIKFPEHKYDRCDFGYYKGFYGEKWFEV